MKFFRLNRYWQWRVGILAWSCLSACGPVTENQGLAGPCTETGNPTGIRGKILNMAGNPASGAVVKLMQRMGTDSSGIAGVVSQTTACSDGSFGFAKLAASSYALEAFDSASGKIAWFPKADISDSDATVHISLVLESPGAVQGTVTRGPNPRPNGILNNEKIVMRLIHTDKSYLSDTTGAYRLAPLGAGFYRAVFTALDGHYLTAYVDSVQVRAGETTILPRMDLVWSPYVAPPIPSAPSVDSIAVGTIRVHWNPVFVSNFSHYEVLKRDSLALNLTDTLTLVDTVLVDSLKAFASGHKIEYRVRSVNKLGTKSEWSSIASTTVTKDTTLTGEATLGINVKTDGVNAIAIKVRLFRIPKNPRSPDSLPAPVTEVGDELTGMDGSVLFTKLSPELYGIEAGDSLSHKKAYRILAVSGHMNLTLDLKSTGELQGTVSRQQLWVSAPFKGDENIQVSLSGTPYVVYSDYGFPDGVFKMTGIPAGTYNLIVFAPPEGYFLADTLKAITVVPGDTTTVPLVVARYNPSAPPPKIFSLKILSVSSLKVTLQWQAVFNYPFLKAYEVLRLDDSLKIMATSGPVTATTWEDNLVGVLPGTSVHYVIRIMTTGGLFGEKGGDPMGNPILFQVPN